MALSRSGTQGIPHSALHSWLLSHDSARWNALSRPPSFALSLSHCLALRPDCFSARPDGSVFSQLTRAHLGTGLANSNRKEHRMRTKPIRSQSTCRLALEELENRLVLS